MRARDLEADPETSRSDTVTAALLFLMTHYVRTGCPRLALCIFRHMQCLAAHPDAASVVREICSGMHGAWRDAACRDTCAGDGTVH